MGFVEIDGRNVGKIIGPKGATIRQLQSEYNVTISIANEDNTVRFPRELNHLLDHLVIFMKLYLEWKSNC